MSRIGRAPITVPAGVEVKVDGQHVSVKGPKGTLEMNVAPTMKVEVEAGVVHVTRPNDEKMNRSLHGLTRTLINNMVIGVSEGFSKTLEVNGVGYRAAKEGKNLVLHVGYSLLTWFSTSATLIRSSSPRPRTSRSTFPMQTMLSSRVSTSRRSASLQQKFVASVLPSRTRARASSMTTKLSAAKKARPALSNRRCA